MYLDLMRVRIGRNSRKFPGCIVSGIGTGGRWEDTWPAVEERHGDCIWLLREECDEVDFERFRVQRNIRDVVWEGVHVGFELLPMLEIMSGSTLLKIEQQLAQTSIMNHLTFDTTETTGTRISKSLDQPGRTRNFSSFHSLF